MKKLGLSGLELFWENIFRLIKLVTGDVKVNSKGTLQKQIDDMSNRVDDCFRNASDGKNLIADAITGKGVPTLGSDTFATIAANIAKIKNIATLQRKTAALNINNPSVTLTPDSGYDGLSQAAVSITLQEKTQSVTAGNVVVMPDTGKVLSKVTVNGPTDRGAWTGQTTDNNNVPIPAGYHNGNGYVSGAGAYNKGVSDADARANANSANYKSGYNAGVSATKRGTAGTGDVLSGKTFTNASSVGASGTMANKGGTTVTAGSVTQDSSYTYFGVPSSGYYSTGSKLRALNSNLHKHASGKFTSSNVERLITCGFKPDLVFCYQTTGGALYVYDAFYSTTDFFYDNGSDIHTYKAIGSTTYGLRSIETTGFKVRQAANASVNWNWIALKF